MSAASFKDLGNKHLQAKEYDEAIGAYTKAIELDPNDHIFYSNRSAAYLSKGDAISALDDGEQCIIINPTFAKGYSRKGAALHALKRYTEAIQCYEEGLSIAPTDAGLLSGKSDVEKERQLHVMEIQSIFSDPYIQQILRDFSANPSRARRAIISDPLI